METVISLFDGWLDSSNLLRLFYSMFNTTIIHFRCKFSLVRFSFPLCKYWVSKSYYKLCWKMKRMFCISITGSEHWKHMWCIFYRSWEWNELTLLNTYYSFLYILGDIFLHRSMFLFKMKQFDQYVANIASTDDLLVLVYP